MSRSSSGFLASAGARGLAGVLDALLHVILILGEEARSVLACYVVAVPAFEGHVLYHPQHNQA